MTTATTVRCDMTVSLDGFVCGTAARKPPYLDDGFFRIVRWLTKGFDAPAGSRDAVADPEAAIAGEREAQVGAYVLGRRMYDSAGDAWSVESSYRAPVYVVTNRPHEPIELKDGTTFHFVTEGVPAAVALARAAAGERRRKAHVSGGAEIVRQALAAGLIDELHLHLAPVLLGQGTRLFEDQPDRITELERFHVVDGTDATHLSFRIPRTDTDTDADIDADADPAQEA
jgi:dihydrofolate reductase